MTAAYIVFFGDDFRTVLRQISQKFSVKSLDIIPRTSVLEIYITYILLLKSPNCHHEFRQTRRQDLSLVVLSETWSN